MIPIGALFESHLTVSNLERSMAFYGGTLGLQLAHLVPERRAVFYWLGGAGKSMLGLWEMGAGPQRLSLHVAFQVELADLRDAPQRLRAAGVTPRDFFNNVSDEVTVLAWMPAASLFFHDPDGNLLEFLTMLPDKPKPELGVVSWSRWQGAAGV